MKKQGKGRLSSSRQSRFVPAADPLAEKAHLVQAMLAILGKVGRTKMVRKYRLRSLRKVEEKMKRAIGVVSCIFLFTLLAFPQVQHGIRWSWTRVTTDTAGNTISVDGYNLYCGTASSGPFVKKNTALIPDGTSPNYLDTNVTLSSTYYCQATASKGGVESARSVTSSGTLFQFPAAAPAAPQGVVE